MAQINNTNKVSVKEIKKALGFTSNLIDVKLKEEEQKIIFKFWDYNPRRYRDREIGYFEIHKDHFDFEDFDEFAYRCITDFDSESMSAEEIAERGNALYSQVFNFLKNKAKLQKNIFQKQKSIKAKVLDGMNAHIFVGKPSMEFSVCF